MSAALLEVKDLRVTFEYNKENFCALKGVCFRLHRGEIVAVVGESGSGKTTLALALLQLFQTRRAALTSGEILLSIQGGETTDLLKSTESQLAKIRGNVISLVFQEPMSALNPLMTCGTQIAESLIFHKKMSSTEAKAAVLQQLHIVQIADPERIYNAFPHELSGGEKQRVLIAVAICCNPELIIADEATTAMDPLLEQEVIELFLKIKQETGAALLVISHNMGLVSRFADRIFVMNNGEMVEQGTALDILGNPKNEYVRDLMSGIFISNRQNSNQSIKTASSEKGSAVTRHKVKADRTQNERLVLDRSEVLRLENIVVTHEQRTTRNTFSKMDKVALKNVGFTLHKGEILGVVGPSGAGKTTLGKALLGFVKLSSGKIFFEGQQINSSDAERERRFRKTVQMIFQDPGSSLNPAMPVGKALLEPMKVHKIGTSDAVRQIKVSDLLLTVGLDPNLANRYPHQLSGGQRQRVAIARALSAEPAVLICDECVSSLDMRARAQILTLLRELRDKLALSIVFISHDWSAVNFMADRVLVMKNGEIVDSGTMEDLYSNPKSDYTRNVLKLLSEKN